MRKDRHLQMVIIETASTDLSVAHCLTECMQMMPWTGQSNRVPECWVRRFYFDRLLSLI